MELKNDKNESFPNNMKILEEIGQDKAEQPLIQNNKSENKIRVDEKKIKVFPIEEYLNNLESLKNFEEKNVEVYYHKNGNKVKKRFKFNK